MQSTIVKSGKVVSRSAKQPEVVVNPVVAGQVMAAATFIASKRTRNYVLAVLAACQEAATGVARAHPDARDEAFTTALNLFLQADQPVVSQRRGAKWLLEQIAKLAAQS